LDVEEACMMAGSGAGRAPFLAGESDLRSTAILFQHFVLTTFPIKNAS
jgi:hypothetical protein